MQQRTRKAIRLRKETNGVSHLNCSEIVIAFWRGGSLHWPRRLGRRRLSSELPNSPSSRVTVASTAPVPFIEPTQRNHRGMDWTALRWRAGNRASPIGVWIWTLSGTGEFWLRGHWRPRMAIDTQHRNNNGKIAASTATRLIRTLRKTYGPALQRAVKTMRNWVTCCTN